MMRHHTSTAAVVVGLLSASSVLVAQVVPEARERNHGAPEAREHRDSSPATVSPGSPTGSLIGDPCPAFSWGRVAGAKTYELLVYRVREATEETEEVLRETLPGSARSWTPSLDRCLERGDQYAWTIRAVAGEEETGWAAPSLFQVASLSSEAQLEAALAVVRRVLAARGAPARAEKLAGKASPAAGAESSSSRATPSPATRGPVATLLSVAGNLDATSFSGDGSGLSGVVADDLSCTDCVGSDEIAGGAVGSDQINAAAIGSDEIATGAVGSDEITGGAVGGNEIADGAVGGDEIATGAVGSGKIAAGAVGSDEIATGAVGSGKIAAGAVVSNRIEASAVTSSDIADGSVFSSKIAAGAVGSDEIADGAVGSSEIADAVIDSTQIADDAVGGRALDTIGIVHVECLGSCLDITFGQICDVVGTGWEPISGSFPVEFGSDFGDTICGGDNECVSLGKLNRGLALGNAGVAGPGTWDATVFCVRP